MTAKSLDSQNVWGGGGGWEQSTIPIQVKISCLKMIKIVLTLIYSQLFCCLVSHNKSYDFYFDKTAFIFIFISVLYRIVLENVCHKSKSPIKMYRN